MSDAELWEASKRDANTGLDFDLGHGLLRRRFPRPRKGHPSKYCSALSIQSDAIAVYLYGFPRGFTDELTLRELETYRHLAAIFLKLDDEAIARAIDMGKLIEIQHG